MGVKYPFPPDFKTIYEKADLLKVGREDFEQSKRRYKLFPAVRWLCVAVDLGKCSRTAIIPYRQ